MTIGSTRKEISKIHIKMRKEIEKERKREGDIEGEEKERKREKDQTKMSNIFQRCN